MKKTFSIFTILLLGLISIQAQTTKSFFLKLGGAYTSFQDVKFSKVPYSGAGGVFSLGFERENTKSIWEAGLAIQVSTETSSTHDIAKPFIINPKAYFKFLKKINNRFSVGGHWDILSLYLRQDNGLGNNGMYYVTSSDLLASVNYKYKKIDFGLDLGILSFVKEGTSFAFSAPQNGLEDGEFDYQNEQLADPFGFKYYEIRSTFKHFILRTNINYQLGKRFEVGYQWNVRHFAEVEDYPVTIGKHNLTIRWDFVHRIKDKVELN